jgi:hypothetical protein
MNSTRTEKADLMEYLHSVGLRNVKQTALGIEFTMESPHVIEDYLDRYYQRMGFKLAVQQSRNQIRFVREREELLVSLLHEYVTDHGPRSTITSQELRAIQKPPRR